MLVVVVAVYLALQYRKLQKSDGSNALFSEDAQRRRARRETILQEQQQAAIAEGDGDTTEEPKKPEKVKKLEIYHGKIIQVQRLQTLMKKLQKHQLSLK